MSSVTRGFSALRHRNYRLFWIGQTISLVGTWMQTVAQAWLVLQLTGSAADLGIVTALQQLPILFLGPLAGVLADRTSKRQILLMTQISQMVLAFVLGVLVSAGAVQIWQIYVLAALLGVANAVDMPTRQAFVMEMVGRDDLMNAVALGSMQFNTARIIGPALAGFSIALIGLTGSFYANAVSFLFVIGGLLMMRPEEFFAVDRAPRTSLLVSLREGAEYAWRSPAIRAIMLLVGTLGLFAMNQQVLVPIMAKNVLHSGAAGYGLLMSAMGAGSLAAALLAAFVQRPRWQMLLGGSVVYCLFSLLFATSHLYWLSAAFMVVAGFAIIAFFTSANTGVQQRVPDQLRGRVMGVYMTVNIGITPIGNLAGGAVAGEWGAAFAMGLGSALGLAFIAGTGAWLFTRRADPGLSLQPVQSASPDLARLPRERLRVGVPAHAERDAAGEPVLRRCRRPVVAGRPDKRAT